jgi:hypothetical protein
MKMKLIRLLVLVTIKMMLVDTATFSSLNFPSTMQTSFLPSQRQEKSWTLWNDILHHRTWRSMSVASTIPEEGDKETPFELWLDLRGTAITPRTALLRLRSPFPIAVVIVSKQDAFRALQFWEQGDPHIMVVEGTTGLLYDGKDSSIRYGTVITVAGSSFIDPTSALDTTAQGGWVLVDSEDNSDKMEERHEAISSLVDFIIGGASLGSAFLTLGSKHVTPQCRGDRFQGNNVKGGIAIACQTKADVVQAANALKSIDAGSLVTTESGILLRTGQAVTTESSSSFDLSLQSALVLPFDLPLWETAILVFMTEP